MILEHTCIDLDVSRIAMVAHHLQVVRVQVQLIHISVIIIAIREVDLVEVDGDAKCYDIIRVECAVSRAVCQVIQIHRLDAVVMCFRPIQTLFCK